MAWTLYEGDCLEIMRQMERESVDAVITDPPYSSGGMFRGDKAKPPEKKYVNPVEVVNFHPTFTGDTMDQRAFFAWSVHWWTLARRLLKPGGFAAVFTDWRQLPITSDAFQAGGLIWRGIVVWDKGPAARPFPGRFRQQTEFIIWGSNGAMPVPENPTFPEGVIKASPFHGKQHIAGKPIAVMEHLMSILPKGAVILDPFAGSGTTLLAAENNGYNSIGIEIEPVYCDIIRRRMANRQTTIFEMGL